MDHHHPPLPLTTTTNNTSPSPAPDPAPAPAPDSASTLAPPTASISELRAELKQWERDFAAAHGGRKAGREDIKMVPEIAKKYKTYDRLRRHDIGGGGGGFLHRRRESSSKPEPDPSPRATASKRPHPPPQTSAEDEDAKREREGLQDGGGREMMQTPCKRTKHTHVTATATATATTTIQPWTLDPYDPPISLLLSPSRARSSIGPTPQKDGRVLGLFDALSSEGSRGNSGSRGGGKTPSKRRVALLPLTENMLQATPSKREKRTTTTTTTEQELLESASKKRQQALLATVTTPSKNRVHQGFTPISQRSLAKSLFDETPAFLRRRSQNMRFSAVGKDEDEAGDDGSDTWSPVAIRKLRPPAGRGLSALVRKLREMEDEHLDDEMAILRDLESGDDDDDAPSQHTKPKEAPAVMVGDSQVADMPLGPDRAIESEEEGGGDGDAAVKENEPSKFRKKKGQKRTTRKVVMKPSIVKWRPEPKWEGGMESDDEAEEEDNTTVVEATQLAKASGVDPPQEDGLETDSDPYNSHDEDKSTGGGDKSKGKLQRQKKADKKKKSLQEEAGKNTTDHHQKEESRTQKLKKKISATAHANFRALKIKNKNSKGKRGGRFGKRR